MKECFTSLFRSRSGGNLSFPFEDCAVGAVLGLLLLVWGILSSPCLLGQGALGMAKQADIRVKGAERVALRIWMPPLAYADEILILEGYGVSWIRMDGKMLVVASGDKIRLNREADGWRGLHRLDVAFAPTGGQIEAQLCNGTPALRHILSGLLLGLMWWLGARLFRDAALRRIFLAAFAIRILYGFSIPWDMNSPDIAGHIEYIRLLARNGIVPAPGACWQCYQPPTYYWLMALIYRLGGSADGTAIELLRAFALFLSAGTLALGMAVVSEALATFRERQLGVALYAFFPAGIYFAPVINNDVLVNLSGMFALYAVLRWRNGGTGRFLVLALAGATISVFFKSNGLLYLGAVLLGILLRDGVRERGIVVRVRPLLAWCGALSIALAATLANSLRSMGAESAGDRVVGNVGRLGLRVERCPNSWHAFLPGTDQMLLLLNPDLSYRQYRQALRGFWTCLVRSSLLDYMAPTPGLGWRIGLVALTVMLAALAAMALKGCLVRCDRLQIVWLLLFLGGVMAFRWRYPYFCSANIRYVFGILVPFTILVVRGAESSTRWKEHFAKIVIWSFIALSTSLYVFYSMIWI